MAAAIAGIENHTIASPIKTSGISAPVFLENSEESGSRMSDISLSGLNLNHGNDNELPPPLYDIGEQGQEHQQPRRRKWVVTCQDILKTRKKVLQVANGALVQGHSVRLIHVMTLLT